MEENLDINNEVNKDRYDNSTKSNSEEIKEPRSEKDINMDIVNSNSQSNSASKVVIKNEIDTQVKPITKPKKELPVEKKPFQEFINIHLIPSLRDEINQRGLEISNINLTNTNRPIAGDKCWVINCEIKNTCSVSCFSGDKRHFLHRRYNISRVKRSYVNVLYRFVKKIFFCIMA